MIHVGVSASLSCAIGEKLIVARVGRNSDLASSPDGASGVIRVGSYRVVVKPGKYITVGAVFNRDFRHLSRLKTAPTDVFHLFTDMSQVFLRLFYRHPILFFRE